MLFAPFVVAICWCAVHFLAYVLLRGRYIFGTERSIFIFHIVPFCVFGAGILWVLPSTELTLSTGAGALAIHGIYSLSFLEAWSLSDGSYSISILKAIHRKDIVTPEQAIAALSLIGEAKKQDRLAALQRLGLLTSIGTRFVLTRRGSKVATALKCLRWLVNYSETD
jgi:hypothetical protein